jgi:hypothetical protein
VGAVARARVAAGAALRAYRSVTLLLCAAYTATARPPRPSSTPRPPRRPAPRTHLCCCSSRVAGVLAAPATTQERGRACARGAPLSPAPSQAGRPQAFSVSAPPFPPGIGAPAPHHLSEPAAHPPAGPATTTTDLALRDLGDRAQGEGAPGPGARRPRHGPVREQTLRWRPLH